MVVKPLRIPGRGTVEKEVGVSNWRPRDTDMERGVQVNKEPNLGALSCDGDGHNARRNQPSTYSYRVVSGKGTSRQVPWERRAPDP